MTESPQRVRATARVTTESADNASSAVLVPRRRPGHLGPVHVIQLLLAEVAIIVLLAVLTSGVIVVAIAAAGCVVLLGVTLARRNGRWWLERRMMVRQYQRRRQTQPAPEDPRLNALRTLAPNLTVDNISAADGSEIGVARDDAGWYGIAVLAPAAAMRDDQREMPPLDALVAALADAEQPGAVLQLVTHTVPAPSLEVHPASPVGQSYRQLLANAGPVPVPTDRATWIAVRLQARALAEAGAYGGDLDRAPAVVAALVRRIIKSLRHTGVACQPLDADGVLAALARSCDLEASVGDAAATGTTRQPREDWTEWHSDRLAHRSFWIRGWPPAAERPALLDWLATAPAALTSVALILTPEEDSIDMRCLVRVAAPAEALPQISEAVGKRAQEMRTDLFQLDGEQAPAAYASAPTGGGPR